MEEAEDMSQAMDAVLLELGWRGRFQLIQLFQVMLCVIPAAFNILSIVFIGKINEHKCKEIDNGTSHLIPPDVTNVTYGTCSVTWVNVTGEKVETSCPNGLEFAEPVDRSLMSELDLVCQKEALTDVSQTLLLAGMVVGALLFSSLADRYGRKPIHISSSLGLLFIGIGSAFVPSLTAFLPLRFFLGAFHQGMCLTSGILAMEILPARRRFTQSIVGSLIWSSGMVVLAVLAFLMRHFSWRHLQLLIAGFSAYSFLLVWFLEESVRWLAANGKVDRAERILKKAAAQNNVSEEEILNIFRTKVLRQHAPDLGHHLKDEASEVAASHPLDLQNANGPSSSDCKTERIRYGFADFFRHKRVFICTVINGFAWFVNSLTYYGLSMTSVTLADDMYLGFFLSAIVELPSMIVLLLGERFGRKRTCDVFHVVAGLSLLTSVALSSLADHSQASSVAIIALSLLGKFAVSGTFALLFLYTPEQFPTNLRNASLGMGSMAGRVGGMVAPYSRTLSRHYPWASGTIFGISCLLLPVCMRMLPETCGRELPQTIEQMEMYITAPYTLTQRSGKKENEEKSDIVYA